MTKKRRRSRRRAQRATAADTGKKKVTGARWTVFSIVALAAAAVAFLWQRGEGPNGSSQNPPNVLIISVDTLRADHLGVYGGDVTTPTFDELGHNGIVFEKASSHAPLTLPTHASIVTGRYPIAHGVRDNGTFRLGDEERTLAEMFLDAGYRTAAFVGSFVLDSRFGLDQGFEVYDDQIPQESERVVSGDERRADQVLRAAWAWLRERGNVRWFALVHLYDPHWPYEPPTPFSDTYRERPYEGEVAYVDREVGIFLERLDRAGMLAGTLVVLTADHGEALGEHGERTHGQFAYESTLRVPLILYWKAGLPQGVRISTRVRLVDLAPTLLQLAGLPPLAGVQGESLLPLLSNPELQSSERDSYFEAVGFALQNASAPLTGLYRGRYKYIHLPLPELYDLEADPKEQRNLVSERPDLHRQMKSALSRFVAESTAPASREPSTVEVDEETRLRLAALGYLTAPSPLKPLDDYTADDDPKRLIDVANMIDDGVRAYRTGDRAEAARLFRGVIERRPGAATAYNYLARVLHEQGRLEEAITVLGEAFERNLRAPGMITARGIYLQEAGKLEASIAALEPLVYDGGRDPRAYEALAISYTGLGRVDEAIRTLEELVNLEPNNATAHTNLAPLYMKARRFDDAERVLRRAVVLDPSRTIGWHGLGVVHEAAGRHEEAIAAWKHAIELDGPELQSMYNLAVVLAQNGHREEALAYFRRFIESAPREQHENQVAHAKRMVRELLE